MKLDIKITLEGVEIPFISWNVTATVQGIAGAISIPPLDEAYNIKPNTHVAIFYKYNHQESFYLLCDGFIVGKTFSHPNQSVSYTFEGALSRLKYIPYLQTDYRYSPELLRGNKIVSTNEISIISLVSHITETHSVCGGIKQFISAITGISGVNAKPKTTGSGQVIYGLDNRPVVQQQGRPANQGIDEVTLSYLKGINLPGRIRLGYKDSLLQEIIKTKGFENALQNKIGMEDTAVSVRSFLNTIVKQIYYNMSEQFSPVGGIGNIDFVPQMDFVPPPLCNTFFPSSFQGSENMMTMPTRVLAKGKILNHLTGKGRHLESATRIQTYSIAYPPEILQGNPPLTSTNHILPGTEEEYKGIVYSAHSLIGIPSTELTRGNKEIEQRTAAYLWYMARVQNRSIPSIDVGFFNPMVVVSVPGIVINPSNGHHYLGVVSSVTHSGRAKSAANTSVGLTHCIPIEDLKQSMAHPWLDPALGTISGIKSVYESMYGTTVIGNSSSMGDYQKDVTAWVNRLVAQGKSPGDIYKEYGSKKGVITMESYEKQTQGALNEKRGFYVKEFIDEYKRIAKRGGVHYGFNPTKQNSLKI